MILVVCALCGRNKPHEARGLCKPCYIKASALRMRHVFPTGRRAQAAQDRRPYWRARYQQRRADASAL